MVLFFFFFLELSRALLILVCHISPRIQDSTVITRLLLLVYVTPESKWKLFDYGKNVRHWEWKLSLAGTSISLMEFPVFPPDWAAELGVSRWGRGQGQQMHQGHRERSSEIASATRFWCGRNEKKSDFCQVVAGTWACKLRLQVCFREHCLSCRSRSVHVPAIAPQPLSSAWS